MSQALQPPVVPYGAWPSPLSSALLAQASVSLGSVGADIGRVFWVEGRPAEGGRNVLMAREPDGRVHEPLPARFNVRSRVHEYGGRAYAVQGRRIAFCHFADQRLYLVDGATDGGAEPRPITPDGCRYADFSFSADGRWLYAVREDHRAAAGVKGEPRNQIVAIDTQSAAAADGSAEGTVLYGASDFVAAPTPGPGGWLAWIAWSHPDMPWDATRLLVARVEGDRAGEPLQVAGGADESVLQPLWVGDPDGAALVFASDRSGYWNLYRWRVGEPVQAITALEADLAGPLWQLGARSVALVGDGERRQAIAIAERNAVDTLLRIDLATGAATELLGDPAVAMGSLACVDGQHVVLVVARRDRLPAIERVDLGSGRVEVLRASMAQAAAAAMLPPAFVSPGEAIRFPTRPQHDCPQHAHAFFHPPRNPQVRAPADRKPPLMVLLHGGPTAHATAELKLAIQFWTTRGFAVVNVNYRGSTGFGRAYRNLLRGQWGVADVEDAVAAVDFLAARGDIDPARVVIRGGSAGGFTVLAALAFTRRFAAGINYFGVADLESLAADTHKFESRYLDRLVAPLPEGRAIYRARSPIHHLAQLDAALISFQGSEDRAVPPQQSRAITAAVKARGRPVAYLEFAGEQHGFRQAANIIRAQDAEQHFLGRIFGFTPADAVEPVTIDNL